MKKSESIKSIAKALSQLQAAIKAAPFDSINPHFKNRYASLNSVVETIQPHLLKNGLSYTQGETEDGKLATMIMHESGEWIESYTSLVLDKQNMQGLGSAQTYGKRYGLSAAFGVVADFDDDGEIASKPTAQKPSDEKTITFGKFKGQDITTLSASDIGNYITWLRNTAKEQGKDLSPSAQEFIDLANKYKAQLK